MRIDNGSDDTKYYIVKAEWFWTRIAHSELRSQLLFNEF